MAVLFTLFFLMEGAILFALLIALFRNAKRVLATKNGLAKVMLFPFRLVRAISGEEMAVKMMKLIAILGMVAVTSRSALQVYLALSNR